MKTVNYPDGRKMQISSSKTDVDHRLKANRTDEDKARDKYVKANMGMQFESDVSKSCEYYILKGLACIYKRPTPIKVVKMSKTKPGMIEEAYFQEKSTTDYVGIYKGKYVDFECKETIHDSIPYSMIRSQQYTHLERILNMGGIGFFLVSFKKYQEVYLLNAQVILDEIKGGKHPGFKKSFFMEKGILVKRGYNPPYELLAAIDQAFGL
ncbi:MAG: Holliday junction resolvase RecU [Bacilli bacterium]